MRYKNNPPCNLVRRGVFLIWLLLLPAAFAYTFQPSSVDIEAVVGKDGVASVRERYVITFSNPEELNTFKGLVDKLGNSFYLWAREIEGFTYHFGTAFTDLRDITITTQIASNRLAYIVLTYRLQLAKPNKDTPTSTEWVIVDFRFPWVKDAYRIPEGYTVSVVLPSEATVVRVEPETEVKNNVVKWEGPLATNKLMIIYSTPKVPKPVSILELLSKLSISAYFLVAILVLGAILLLFRRRISLAIERYVVNNSEFSEEE